SDIRSEYGKMLSARVMTELPPLKLEKATFEVVVNKETDENKFSSNGIDTVCFMGSTNFGTTKNYIHKIASGGELARFTLAIKVVISDASIISSMIFDEVDTGISGATAAAVGERLARLSKSIQILVVTHSPQVASFGNHHFKVSKYFDADKNTTVTSVEQLSEPQRVNEIARIISGDKITPEAISAAEKLFITSIKA
ncbi:MAG: DNA repair protein RecN, partial [Alphaproteobacteria bacterium]|nr:DNA repair protein RecN [Alphaproteobacteria bacterium]